MTPSSALPDRPDLDQLRRRAKELARQVTAGAPEQISRVVRWHPRVEAGAQFDPATFSLREAQLVIAREHGFDGWADLRAAVASTVATPDRQRWQPPAAADLTFRAFAQARRLGHAYCSVEHVLLALLDPPFLTIAQTVLSECGLTFDAIRRQANSAFGPADGDPVSSTSSTPNLHRVMGTATGIALLDGAATVEDEHALLVLCYDAAARTPDILNAHGVDRDEVVGALADRGVHVPPVLPSVPEPPVEWGPRVYYPARHSQAVIDALKQACPVGTSTWGFNVSAWRPGDHWVDAEADVALADIVREAIEDPDEMEVVPEDVAAAEEHRAPRPAT